MDIKRAGSQASKAPPSDYFTGTVRLDPLHEVPEPGRVSIALVTFEPHARTNWHTHAFGQTLIVTAGSGWVQREGGAKETVSAGDVIFFPAGEKHWHGAAATTAMSHIAVQERDESGSAVEWLEPVGENEYND